MGKERDKSHHIDDNIDKSAETDVELEGIIKKKKKKKGKNACKDLDQHERPMHIADNQLVLETKVKEKKKTIDTEYSFDPSDTKDAELEEFKRKKSKRTRIDLEHVETIDIGKEKPEEKKKK